MRAWRLKELGQVRLSRVLLLTTSQPPMSIGASCLFMAENGGLGGWAQRSALYLVSVVMPCIQGILKNESDKEEE